MRLTLRTLLAYLDNTLDAEDAETLKAKLAESSFATQLVQRIRAALHNQSLAAPSPEAIGPVEDANVISEYLDSTLSSEQVAEIERACLESDPHLAEAAACHQILTMVLDKPANVPPALRERIYQLPDRELKDIAADTSYSSLAVPAEPVPASPHWADDVPTADATLPPSQSVPPAGVNDSGVSDAPTRLRQMQESGMAGGIAHRKGESAIAGSKPRPITDSEIYGGSIRPSRITPWLVSLAVIGILLFALSRIFAPLLSRDQQLANVDTVAGVDGPADQSNQSVEMIDDPRTIRSASDSATNTDSDDDAVVDAAIADDQNRPAASDDTIGAEATENAPPIGNEENSPEPIVSRPVEPIDLSENRAGEESPASSIDSSSETMTQESEDSAASSDTSSDGTLRVPPPATPIRDLNPSDRNGSPAVADSGSPSPETPLESDGDLSTAAPQTVGRVVGSTGFVAANPDQQWERLTHGAPIQTDTPIVVAPTFRSSFEIGDQIEATVIGPASFRLSSSADQPLTVVLDHGRFLMSANEPNTKFFVELAGQPLEVQLVEPTDLVALEADYQREPGLDPLNSGNHIASRFVTAVAGTIGLSNIGPDNISLETGQQIRQDGDEAHQVVDIDPLPEWTQTPADEGLTLAENARRGLLKLLAEDDQALETALREATTFRQSEVAALAGRTLLALGRGDVYFDSAGILNQPKQRAYWPEHYLSLQRVVNLSADAATSLNDSIQRMDSTNAEAIMRLLTGYSQQELETGGDQELVEFLDSPSMAVRVLALENLRQMLGTTLYYRAEQENPVRRDPWIKKWLARLRNGDIRWPQ